MKNLWCSFVLLFILVFVCGAEGIADESAALKDRIDLSYAFGMAIGEDLKQTGLSFSYNAFTRGLRDALEGYETSITKEEAVEKVQSAFREALTEQKRKSQEREAHYFEENAKKEGIITTNSGLQYEVISEGSGPKPSKDTVVVVQYEGVLIDGTVFDSTFLRDGPEEIPLNQVIPGWSEGVQLMNTGSVYRFYIPSGLAYGERGGGDIIPPYSPLIFRVELMEILEELPEEKGVSEPDQEG
ncbi:MAG: FKBP-type peptidyl-prolyl cis-trans isomerase [Treponema sp.]|jgi:FKBP-type peptidyl-prolyl cis-trans isomerase FkpA|nr:FKBP-type peptidyl-prolyl cis-trans isomerase [Treponema sp.]